MNVKATVILLLLDALWIGLYMGGKYHTMIPRIQRTKMLVNPLYVLLSYMLMVIGLNIFVMPNIRNNNRLKDSIIYGFLFGIVLYGVYDFTAAAVLKNWDTVLALQDILWGGTVFFLSAYYGSK